jgi:hypothetical protein
MLFSKTLISIILLVQKRSIILKHNFVNFFLNEDILLKKLMLQEKGGDNKPSLRSKKIENKVDQFLFLIKSSLIKARHWSNQIQSDMGSPILASLSAQWLLSRNMWETITDILLTMFKQFNHLFFNTMLWDLKVKVTNLELISNQSWF